MRTTKGKKKLKGISNNCLFAQLWRQLRARILIYPLYTAVLRAVLPDTRRKILIFRRVLNIGGAGKLQSSV